MTEPAPGEPVPLVDLSGISLERIARLCETIEDGPDSDDAADRPALRRAFRRVLQDGETSSGLFAGFSSHLL